MPQMLHLDTVVATRDDLQIHRDRALALGARELLDRADDQNEPLYVSPTLPDTRSEFLWDDPRIPLPPAGEADASKTCFKPPTHSESTSADRHASWRWRESKYGQWSLPDAERRTRREAAVY